MGGLGRWRDEFKEGAAEIEGMRFLKLDLSQQINNWDWQVAGTFHMKTLSPRIRGLKILYSRGSKSKIVQGRWLNRPKCILEASSFNEWVPDFLLQLLVGETKTYVRELTNPINVHVDLGNPQP